MISAEIRKRQFVAWYQQYGTPAKMGLYFNALDDPNAVLDYRDGHPARPEFVQNVDRTLFPPVGHSVYEYTDLPWLRTLFDNSNQNKTADDGSIKSGIGNYALWLRLMDTETWLHEPFWDGDCVAAGTPTGRTRMATLLKNGLDYLKELEHRKATYKMDKYLAAIRTKPFILMAGISGTGKSRLVRQLARGCCPDGHELGKNKDGTANAAKKPGNFEMIPVRPNWHDSSELMGYVTRITDDGKPKYVIKPLVKFLVKAAIYKDVPFFLCLDEMNLAPVEQYFAEYLSVVETRKVVKDAATGAVTDIVSDVLVDFDQPEIDIVKTAQELMADWLDFSFAVGEDEQPTITVVEKVPGAKAVYDQIVADKGVRIPRNFVVMGTVNMDETTCSFSRKVLDRAMTFELNDVNIDEGLATSNEIPYGAIPPSAAFATAVEGFDFYLANQTVCNTIKTYLNAVNAVLDGTPFKFAYRSRNEIMLYCIERMKSGVIELPTALDEATSMKILSRIEGDEDKLAIYKLQGGNKVRESLLDVLIKVIPAALKVANDNNDPNPACEVCAKKLEFMQNRLVGGFTNFFV